MYGHELIYFCDVNTVRQNFLQKQSSSSSHACSYDKNTTTATSNVSHNPCPVALWPYLLSKVQDAEDEYYYDDNEKNKKNKNKNEDDENDFYYLYLSSRQKTIRTLSIVYYLLTQSSTIFA